MGARFRSWWQQIKKHRVAIGVVAMVLVVAITLIIVGYWFDWAGFNGYNKITVAHTISGTNAGTVIRTEEYQPGRTLWDWMQLLFIPVVLAVAGFWFNHRERRSAELLAENERKAAELRAEIERKAAEFRAEAEREIEQQRAETEREIAIDNQREATLQAYIDKMSELLLHENLRDSAEKDEVRRIARVRTLRVLAQLDAKRKKNVLQFLHESELISADNSPSFSSFKNIITLTDADLVGADLSGISLYVCDLSSADLRGANLSDATLRSANLNRSDLRDANLTGAIVKEAILIRAKMENTNLKKANLFGADLRDVNLSGADLSDADLSAADLSGANLSAALVTPEQLNKVKSLKGARMPDGSIHM